MMSVYIEFQRTSVYFSYDCVGREIDNSDFIIIGAMY